MRHKIYEKVREYKSLKKGSSMISINYDFKNRKRRQEITTKYVENGSIYIFKPEIRNFYKLEKIWQD